MREKRLNSYCNIFIQASDFTRRGRQKTTMLTSDSDIINSTTAALLDNMSSNVSISQSSGSYDDSLSILLPKLYFWLFGVVLCILSLVGIVTNVINIYALTLTVQTNRRPMYHCLICMAVVDMLVCIYY